MSDLSVGETDVQWLMSVYALVEAIVIPLNAFFLGRFSTRKLFVASFALFGAGSVVVAAGPSFAWLIAGRAGLRRAASAHHREPAPSPRP